MENIWLTYIILTYKNNYLPKKEKYFFTIRKIFGETIWKNVFVDFFFLELKNSQKIMESIREVRFFVRFLFYK